MTEKGYKVLEAIATNFPQILKAVVSARDPNISKDYYNEIEVFCKEKGIIFCDRKNFEVVNSNFAIAVSWRWLIDSSSTMLIVFHDSLLPKYRGFAPLVSALSNGEKIIGVTALFATEDYDCGDIISQSAISVTYPIKIQNAIELLTENYKQLATDIAKIILEGESLNGSKQNEEKASYSLWRDEEDYTINWEMPAEQIKRFIDAVGYPYKGAMTIVGDKNARVLEAEVFNDVYIENRTSGKIIFIKNNYPVIVCGKGLLMITNIVDNESGNSLLPFNKFRLRLK
jgi:methionyl-tRNA formyltransferase